MSFLAQGKTNWKYILIALILAIVVGGIILGWIKMQEFSPTEFSDIKKPEKVIEEEELCFKGILEGQIMEEITDESLRTLIIGTALETFIEYGYEKEEACKAQHYEIKTPLGSGGKVDLNEDGIPEFIISVDCFDTEDNFHCIGGSGGTAIFIFGLMRGEWKLIGKSLGTRTMILKTRRTNLYFNLATHIPGGACCGGFYEYSWNGEKYELIKTMNYDREKGYDNVDSEIWSVFYEQAGG